MMDILVAAWAMIGVVVLIVGIAVSAIFLVMWVCKLAYQTIKKLHYRFEYEKRTK